ncbi:MAG: HAMP domain-containing histidine kinase [Bacteroidales bacterium]|nr:HAMP domain-containing histidine kinase [Bacteroidales bacterium]
MRNKTNELIISNKLLAQNLRRLHYLPFVSIPINIGHILFFWYNLSEPNTLEHTWGNGIIISHAVLIFIALCIWVLTSRRNKIKSERNSLIWFAIHIIAFLFVLVGVAIVVLDQLVTPAITPYILMTIVAAVLFLTRPRYTFIIFGTAFLLFYFTIPITQSDPAMLLSGRVNAMAATGLGVFASILSWRRNRAAYEQSLIIEDQQKALEASNMELKKQAVILHDTNATKDKLFSIIAHDLKNPFSGIIGLSEVLKNEARTLDADEMENYASIIYDTAHQAHELLENLLEWAKIQQGNMVFAPKTIKLKDIADNALLLVNNNAIQKNISIENEIAEDIVIEADENMLNTILRNLLTNAVKFSNNGGTVTIFIAKTKNGLQLTVKDNGIGISAGNIPKLFKTGSDFNERGTANEKGSGLGLVLCKEFVERHNGKLWVESEEGKGSAFNFLIPCNMG